MAEPKVLKGYPPNYTTIAKVFGVKGRNTIIFAYAPHIYAPSGRGLRVDLIEHEKVHLRQQGDDPAGWWERYMCDSAFRADQEVEAYTRQLHVAKLYNNRKDYTRIVMDCVKQLSGPIYGNVLTRAEAEGLLA